MKITFLMEAFSSESVLLSIKKLIKTKVIFIFYFLKNIFLLIIFHFYLLLFDSNLFQDKSSSSYVY
jgi:glycopeptide antibiotics resistance protein